MNSGLIYYWPITQSSLALKAILAIDKNAPFDHCYLNVVVAGFFRFSFLTLYFKHLVLDNSITSEIAFRKSNLLVVRVFF